MSLPAYDLIEIVVGTHEVTARPIEWDGKDFDGQGNGENGKPINAIMYMTTCPGCAQLIQFSRSEIYTATDKSVNNVHCEACKLGKPHVPTMDEVHDLIVVLDEPNEPTDDEKDDEGPTADVFVDPILSGDFDIPVDADRL